MWIGKLLSKINKVTFKTIYFNFTYFPFQQAIKFPVFISNRVLLLKAKGKVTIHGKLKPGLIEIGFGNVSIFDKARSRTIWDVAGDVTFKGRAYIGHGSKISVNSNAILILGDHFEISAESAIIVYKKVAFGDNCLLSWEILLMDSDAHTIKDKQNQAINPPKEIKIGDKVWIGARCTILKGASIPDGSVIATGSLVNKVLVGSNKIFGGIPAKELKSDITWHI